MSRNVAKASDEGQDERQDDFVLDFLYNDARRVGSFLAQFDSSGHLQRVTQRESASKGRKRGFKVNFSGGATVLGTGGSGGVGLERGPSEEGTEALEREYDPLWANALTLLDYLDDRGLIQRDVGNARIGQFLIAKGKLAITDLALVRRSMDLPTIKKLVNPPQKASGRNRHERRAAQSAGQGPEMNLQDMAMEMLTVLPHTVQGRVYTDDGHAIWSTLDRSVLAIGAEDLFLKHGVAIGGEWSMLGIVDALPGTYGNLDGGLDIMTEIDPENPGGELIAKLAAAIVPFSKLFLGRPDTSFGMTPLLIFRQVSG